MNPERWRHIERLYRSALERPSREREAFLESECRGDEDLRLDVQSRLNRAVLTGRRLGVYVVQAPLGAGGTGVVYRALDTNLNPLFVIRMFSGLMSRCRMPALPGASRRRAELLNGWPLGRRPECRVCGGRGQRPRSRVAGAPRTWTQGDAPTLICRSCNPPQGTDVVPSRLSWTPDGKFLYLIIAGSTYAIPLRPGQMLPPIQASGFESKEAVAALPGARLVSEQSVFPGPNPSVYALMKVSAQHNIYRVPVP